MAFPAILYPSGLDGVSGFTITRYGIGAHTFNAVDGAGDINGDGIDDIVLGATGQAFVVFGQSEGFSSGIDTSALDGATGFIINGLSANDGLSTTVAGIGDVNGDGVDDIAIGGRSRAYVIFGNSTGFAGSVDLATLDGSNGFVITDSGGPVAAAGDINSDGIEDFAVGTTVVFGHSGAFNAAIQLSALGVDERLVVESDDAPLLGGVKGAGDVNGDGFADLIGGAGNSFDLKGYVIFGRAEGPTGTVELTDLTAFDGFEFTIFTGAYDYAENYDYDRTGHDLIVTGVGDVDGDGRDDIGASVRIVTWYDNAGPYEDDLTTLYLATGEQFSFYTRGTKLVPVGDINGDGLDDIASGPTSRYYTDYYETAVLLGSEVNGPAHPSGFPPLSLFDGDAGFIVQDTRGVVAGVGDVNGDGIDDLFTDHYVVFGRDTEATVPNLAPVVSAPVLARTYDNFAPISVNLLSNASDPNNDPLSIINFLQTGGPSAPSLTVSGSTLTLNPRDFGTLPANHNEYLTFAYQVSDGTLSTPQTLTLTIFSHAAFRIGTGGDDSLLGTRREESMMGLDGNDTIEGDGGYDTLRGGSGSDLLYGGTGDDSLKGGIGDDRLWGDAGNDTINGEGGEDRLFGGDGDDRLIGWHSHDTMTGGAGSDLFIFHPDPTLSWTGDAPDVITDFSSAEGDKISLQKFDLPDYAALQALFVDQGADTLIDLSHLPGGRDILVEGVTLAQLDNPVNFAL